MRVGRVLEGNKSCCALGRVDATLAGWLALLHDRPEPPSPGSDCMSTYEPFWTPHLSEWFNTAFKVPALFTSPLRTVMTRDIGTPWKPLV